MDKLRSLTYVLAAAETGSFSGAARKLGVSVAAVGKLVGALEVGVGAKLFERHSQGLTLTAGGARYVDSCRAALALLDEADEQLGGAAPRARGTVVVGTQPVIMQECLAAALPRFNALYPDIQLDIRCVSQPSEPNAAGVDVLLLLGWPKADDLVQRRIGASSFVVCAAPSYWDAHGMPQHPRELEQHNCLTIRGNIGTVMDLWHFKRGDERVAVTARGWLVTDNQHRDTVRDVLRSGGGVGRILDWHKRRGHELASGALIAALTDWEQPEVPPMNLLYPPSVRRVARVRLFIDFVTQLFRDIELQREQRAPASGPPQWLKNRPARASATLSRGR